MPRSSSRPCYRADNPRFWITTEEKGPGLQNYEFTMGSKWLELLKQVAPHVTRVAMIYNPAAVPYEFVRQLEAIGPPLGLQPIHVPILPLSPQRLAQVEAELRLLG